MDIITASEVIQLMEGGKYDGLRQDLSNKIVSLAKQGERVCYYEKSLPSIILKELEDAGYIISYGFFSNPHTFFGYKIEW